MRLDEYSYAEALQMYHEQQRERWNHPAMIASYIIASNWDHKKGKPPSAEKLNPYSGKTPKRGIPLNSPEGFAALAQLAVWPARK